jgi:hypothetical protein
MKILLRTVSGVFLAALFAGCVSSPKINWDARVGNFTHDQAVIELGPPDRESPLTDGSVVAEWLLARGGSHTYVSPGYEVWTPRGYLPGGPTYADTVALPDYFIRLTFGADGQLRTWKKFAR